MPSGKAVLKQTIVKKKIVYSTKMLNLSLKEFNLSLKELKAIADIRGIRGYESMSEDRLLSDLKASKSVKKE